MNKLLYFALFVVLSFGFLEAQNTTTNGTTSATSCYCEWYPLPLLQKSYNNSLPGALSFGSRMQVNHNLLVASAITDLGGSGTVSIYTRFANFPYWTFRTVLTAVNRTTQGAYYFGQYLTVYDDANIVTVENGPLTGRSPVLYSFERSAPNTWINVQAPFSIPNVSRFGVIGGYGKILVVAYSARPSGVILLNKFGYNWTETGRIVNPEGGAASSVYLSISVASYNLFALSTSTGTVHVFTRITGRGFVPTIIPLNGTNAVTVELHPDGTTLFVGMPNSIQIYTRNADGTFPTAPTETLYTAGTSTFNSITTIRARGSFVVVADSRAPPSASTQCAPSSTTTGAVYVFSRVGATLTFTQTLKPSVLEDSFGETLAFSNTQGNIITVGGIYDTVYTFISSQDVATPPCPTTAPATRTPATRTPALTTAASSVQSPAASTAASTAASAAASTAASTAASAAISTAASAAASTAASAATSTAASAANTLVTSQPAAPTISTIVTSSAVSSVQSPAASTISGSTLSSTAAPVFTAVSSVQSPAASVVQSSTASTVSGSTGSTAAPVFSELASQLGIPTVSVLVTSSASGSPYDATGSIFVFQLSPSTGAVASPSTGASRAVATVAGTNIITATASAPAST